MFYLHPLTNVLLNIQKARFECRILVNLGDMSTNMKSWAMPLAHPFSSYPHKYSFYIMTVIYSLESVGLTSEQPTAREAQGQTNGLEVFILQ